MNTTQISMQTVRYFKRIMRPIAEDGIIPLPEYHEAISQLTSLAEHGILKPTIVPKLIDHCSETDRSARSRRDARHRAE